MEKGKTLLRAIWLKLLYLGFLGWIYLVFSGYFPRLEQFNPRRYLDYYRTFLPATFHSMWQPGVWLLKAGAIELMLMLWLTLVIYGIGRKALRWIGSEPNSFLEEFLLSTGLGFGLLTYLVLGLGLVGLLRISVAWLIMVFLFLWGAKEIGPFLSQLAAAIRKVVREATVRNGILEACCLCFLVLFAFLYLVGALTPEFEFDALSWHLAVPKIWVQYHRIPNLVGDDFPVIPQSNYPFSPQMLYTLALLLRGQILAKLFHFAMGFLSMLLVYSFSQRYLSSRVGILAASLFYSAPLVGWESTTAYVDLTLTFFQGLAIYAVINWFYSGEDNWLACAGIALGLALGCLYRGIYALPPILVIIIWKMLAVEGKRRAIILRQGALLLVIAFLIFVPWLVKNYFYTGNPVYPFLNEVFHSPLWSPEFGGSWLRGLYRYGMGRNLLDYLRLPWDMTMHGDKFEGTVGPIFLVFLPVLPFLHRRPTTLKLLSVLTILLFIEWALLPQQLRFFVPTLPWLSILVGYVVAKVIDWGKSNKLLPLVPAAAFFLMLTFSLPIFWELWQDNWIMTYRPERSLQMVLGEMTPEEFLSLRLPEFLGYNYSTIEYVNTNLPESSRILVLEPPPFFYFDRQVVQRVDYRDTFRSRLLSAATPDEFMRNLHKHGITHIRVRGDQLPEDVLARVDMMLVYEEGEERLYEVRNVGRWVDHVDFNEEESADQLGIGWYPRDGEQGFYFRWTEKESVVYLKSPGGAEEIVIEGFAPTQCFPQKRLSLSVELDDLKAGDLVLASPDDFSISFPLRSPLEMGVAAIRLHLSETFVPDQCLKNGDLRNLGVAIRRIYLR